MASAFNNTISNLLADLDGNGKTTLKAFVDRIVHHFEPAEYRTIYAAMMANGSYWRWLQPIYYKGNELYVVFGISVDEQKIILEINKFAGRHDKEKLYAHVTEKLISSTTPAADVPYIVVELIKRALD